MSYLEFLGRWFNLVFLGAGAAGVAALLYGKRVDRDVFRPVAFLLATGTAGLTLTGAVHDLRLGSPGDHLALIAPAALLLGGGVAWALSRARDRWFPPVEGVRWNPRDREGAVARVVSRTVTTEPGSGRAQWQDDNGVLTVVRCHTEGEALRFGRDVELREFDAGHRSYRVVRR